MKFTLRVVPLIARLWPGAITVATVALAALAATIGERWLDPPSLALFFVVPIVLAAMRNGLRAALIASVLSVGAINFLFVEPRHTLAVARTQDFGALALFAVVGVLVSVIAERARSAEAVRLEVARERFKSELLAGVSHDLRTPLATIVFTLQSLQRFEAEHPPEARGQLIGLAEGEARRLAGLVDTLLSAARLEAGRAPVQLEPGNIAEIIVAAVDEVKRGANEVEIVMAIGDDLPLVAADPALATMALANVVSNAAKYGGRCAINISTRCEDHNVIVEVADRGPGLGVSPERLFEKFARGVTSDGRPPGLGLGLALARSFMESQGGSIDAANRDGGGAVFSLTFEGWAKAVRHGG